LARGQWAKFKNKKTSPWPPLLLGRGALALPKCALFFSFLPHSEQNFPATKTPKFPTQHLRQRWGFCYSDTLAKAWLWFIAPGKIKVHEEKIYLQKGVPNPNKDSDPFAKVNQGCFFTTGGPLPLGRSSEKLNRFPPPPLPTGSIEKPAAKQYPTKMVRALPPSLGASFFPANKVFFAWTSKRFPLCVSLNQPRPRFQRSVPAPKSHRGPKPPPPFFGSPLQVEIRRGVPGPGPSSPPTSTPPGKNHRGFLGSSPPPFMFPLNDSGLGG